MAVFQPLDFDPALAADDHHLAVELIVEPAGGVAQRGEGGGALGEGGEHRVRVGGVALEAGRVIQFAAPADLEWSDGLEVVELIRDLRPDCPIILFTASAGTEIFNDALRLQVDGYVCTYSYLDVAQRAAADMPARRASTSSSTAASCERKPVGLMSCSSPRRGT